MEKEDIIELFKTSADINSCTLNTINHTGNVLGNKNNGKICIIDTPGLNDSNGESQDSLHIVNMIKHIRDLQNVKMILFTVNG